MIDKVTFEWKVYLKDKLLNSKIDVLSKIPCTLSLSNVTLLFEKVHSAFICSGHSRFPNLLADCLEKTQDVLLCRDRKSVVAYLHDSVIRNINCSILCDSNSMCVACAEPQFRSNLRARESKLSKKVENSSVDVPQTASNSKCNFVHLSGTDAIVRMRNLSKSCKQKVGQIKSLTSKLEKLNAVIERDSIPISETQHNLLFSTVEKGMKSSEIQKIWPADSPQRLFWEQQRKLALAKGPKGMRWHPSLIKWGISLFLKSPAAYRNLNKSGFIKLPSESTLKSYLNFTSSEPDLNPDVMQVLVDEFKLTTCPDFQKNVAIAWDEMKIRSGLVVSKGTGCLVGFTQSDDFSCALDKLSDLIEGGCTVDDNLATHIMVFMVRGLLCRVNLPFIWYPCLGFKSYEIYGAAWTATEALEMLGLKVCAWICDGATPNRKNFKLHSDSENEFCFNSENHFSYKRSVYFVCDVPHLIKTTRNNLENSHGHMKSKNLMKNKKPIKWSHIVQTVEDDMSRSLGNLPKLKHEHIHLSPQLRMRVKLAAQVLSASTSHAILLKGIPEMTETANFCLMFDRWFDCLNGRYLDEGTKKRKSDLLPYKSVDDPRFDWLEKVFLGWLSEWEAEANSIPGLTGSEKKKLLLSQQTLQGLYITTKSFVNLVRDLLRQEGAQYFLPEKINQDRLEVFFGRLRRSVGDSDNPSVEEVRHRIIALLVAGRHSVAPKSTNSVLITDDDEICLPRRKQSKKS